MNPSKRRISRPVTRSNFTVDLLSSDTDTDTDDDEMSIDMCDRGQDEESDISIIVEDISAYELTKNAGNFVVAATAPSGDSIVAETITNPQIEISDDVIFMISGIHTFF